LIQGQTETMRFVWSGANLRATQPTFSLPSGNEDTKDLKGRLQRDLIASIPKDNYSYGSDGAREHLLSDVEPKRAATENPKPFAFIAWFDRSPFEVKVDGKLIPGESANLLYVHLDDINPLHPIQSMVSRSEKN